MTVRPLAILAASLLLVSCAGPGGYRNGRGDVENLAERASIGQVVATELAFARAAREDGQWTAFADFAAANALIFGPEGAFDAKSWLYRQENPAEAAKWRPHAVWSSCDGSLAVSRGGYEYPGGETGGYFTVWERTRDGEYKWLFDFGFETAEPPVAPLSIDGTVADCLAPAEGSARPPLPSPEGRVVRASRDGTLAWTFALGGDPASRSFTVWMLKEGALHPVIDETVRPPQAS